MLWLNNKFTNVSLPFLLGHPGIGYNLLWPSGLILSFIFPPKRNPLVFHWNFHFLSENFLRSIFFSRGNENIRHVWSMLNKYYVLLTLLLQHCNNISSLLTLPHSRRVKKIVSQFVPETFSFNPIMIEETKWVIFNF